VSVQVEVVNIWRGAYAVGVAWRSVGHLTTYGPIDSPTFVTPFSFSRLEEGRTRINQEPELLIAIAVPPG
jgi:hypothetical protein